MILWRFHILRGTVFTDLTPFKIRFRFLVDTLRLRNRTNESYQINVYDILTRNSIQNSSSTAISIEMKKIEINFFGGNTSRNVWGRSLKKI